MSFNQEITVAWLDSCKQESTAGKDEPEDDDELEEDDEYLDEPKWQEFSVDFSCVIEENCCFLSPPSIVERPLECLEQLINIQSKDEILDVLERHGWEIESDSTPGGQGYWGIESITPQLVDWEFAADLLGDGSGRIQITDPTGETHEVEVDAPTDYGDEYLNPTLGEHPDLIGDIFETDAVSSAELIGLLRQVIVSEKLWRLTMDLEKFKSQTIEKRCRLELDLEEFRSQTEVARLMRLKSTP